MRKILGLAAGAAAVLASGQACAQSNLPPPPFRQGQVPADRSAYGPQGYQPVSPVQPLGQGGSIGQTAQRYSANTGGEPDVFLDVPNLSVEQIEVQVDNLQVHLALDARLGNLLKLTAGADASIDKVKITIKGVKATAQLRVHLNNVAAIIDRTLTTVDRNPQLIGRVLGTVDNAVGTVGGVANNAVGTVGGVANTALQPGGAVGQTVNALGQTVSRTVDASGQLVERTLDRSGRVVSSRVIPQGGQTPPRP